MTDLKRLCRRVVAAGTLAVAAAHLFAQTGDYIVAVVNQELVTASEVNQRLARVREEAARNKASLPPMSALRKQVVEALIDERVLVTNARETGARIDDPEIDRAVANVAAQNQMTLAQLRERLQKEGIPFAKYREKGVVENFFTIGGRFNESSEGTSLGMVRKTAPTPVSLRNTLTRNRLPSSDTYDMSMSWPLRNCSWCEGVSISVT